MSVVGIATRRTALTGRGSHGRDGGMRKASTVDPLLIRHIHGGAA